LGLRDFDTDQLAGKQIPDTHLQFGQLRDHIFLAIRQSLAKMTH